MWEALLSWLLRSGAGALSSHQITEVYLPIFPGGHCQLTVPPGHHLHSNALWLINVAELAASPCFQIAAKGHAGGGGRESTFRPLSPCSYQGAAGVRLTVAGSLWRPGAARWGLSGGGSASLCVYPAAFENDRGMGSTNGADPPQIEALRKALECSKMTPNPPASERH